MRIRLTAVLIFLLFSQGTTSSFAESWVAPPVYADSEVAWQITDSFSVEGGISWLKQNTKDASPALKQEAEWQLCTEPGIAPCNRANGTWDANISLPHCESATQEWCIEELTVSPPGPQKVVGEFLRNIAGPKTEAFPSLGIPAGSTAGLWSVKDVRHSGKTDTYVSLVNLRFVKSSQDATPFISYMDARIIPYKQISGNSRKTARPYEQLRTVSYFDSVKNLNVMGISGGSEECAWTEDGVCGEIYDFNPNSKVSLTIRISNKVTGWLMGRLSDPQVTVAPVSASQNRLTIEAKPLAVPLFFVKARISELTDAMKKTFLVDNFIVEKPTGIWGQKGNAIQSLDVIPAWKDAANDRAVASNVTWSFATTNFGSGSDCLKSTDKLMGIVTTNSIAYEGTAPRFVNGFLDYKVAGVHFNPDGSVFEGRYDLVMLKSIAQCLYGFSDAPISATISVLKDGAEERISTTSLEEFGEGAFTWLKLSAQGFTFSNPTLRVKLTQAKAASPVVAQKKKSITCVKGKTVKKVAGVNPKCPTGFRKR